MYDIYPDKEFLRIRFNIDSYTCQICNDDIENVEQLFFQCNLVNWFWIGVHNWIKQKGNSILPTIAWDVV